MRRERSVRREKRNETGEIGEQKKKDEERRSVRREKRKETGEIGEEKEKDEVKAPREE